MHKMVGILVVLSLSGFLQTDVFARRTPNQVEQFMKKREQIKSGTLTYRYTAKPTDYSDGKTHMVRVRFFDIKRGPYNYTYTAIIAEDTFGNVLIYDLDSTYKFATHLKRKKVVPNKEFKHEEQYFYEPFAHYNGTLYGIANDTSYHPAIRDSAFGGSQFQIIETKKYSFNRFIFDSKTSLPIYHLQEHHNGREYTLLDYQLNTFDSASFFRMLADSVKSLLTSCPNSPFPGRPFHYMPPIQDTAAPDFTFASVAGDSIQLSNVIRNNKVVLLNFWFKADLDLGKKSKEAMRALSSVYAKYKGRGLEILSLNDIDKKRETVDSVITEYGIGYPVLLANQATAKKYRLNGYPCIYIIKAGRVEQVLTYENPDIASALKAAVRKYLND
jgi:hypothetical protein